MAAIVWTKRALVERVKRHMANGFPSTSFPVYDSEISLYLDSAIAQRLVGLVYENAKITGVMELAEGFQVTYALSNPVFNETTGEWEAALPQPPMSLPLGYSITNIFFAGGGERSQPVYMIKSKRAAYRDYMPKPSGVSARIENNTMYLQTSNGQPLEPEVKTLYVTMPTARTTDYDAVMNVPEDVITFAFEYATNKIMARFGIPKDIIQDNLGPGNKTS